MTVPTLALVDAFVGGLAILLILIVLSNRTDPATGERPAPDVVLACMDERIVLAPTDWKTPAQTHLSEIWPVDGVQPEVAAQQIAALAPEYVGERLSAQVSLQAESGELVCVTSFERAARARNDTSDATRRPDAAALHLLVSWHLEPPGDDK